MLDLEFARYIENLHLNGVLLQYPLAVAQAIYYGWVVISVDESWDMTYDITAVGDIVFKMADERIKAPSLENVVAPLKDFREGINKFKLVTANEGDTVKIFGVLTGIKTFNTHNGQEMATITLDTGIQAVLFPLTWLGYKYLITIKDKISINGTIIYDGQDKLVNIRSIKWHNQT